MNFFTLFNLLEQFDLDLKTLEQRYFELQKEFHPDRVKGKTEPERLLLVRKSADINQGYRTLKNKVSRVEHLLEIKNIFVTREQNNTYKPSQKTLMLQLEFSERIEDESEDKEKIKLEVKELLNNAFNNFNKYYIEGAFEQAASEYFLIKFLSKVGNRS